MPRFCVLGKYQKFGSDDLVVPTGLEAFTTGMWLTVFGTVYAKRYNILTCAGFPHLHLVLRGCIMVSGVNFVMLLFIVRNTLRGTVINPWPRRSLEKWIGVKAVTSVMSTAFLCFATKCVYLDQYSCDETVYATVRRSVKYLWIPTVIGLYSVFGVIITGTQVLMEKQIKRPVSLARKESFRSVLLKTWAQRVYQISRLLGLEGNSAFMRLGKVMAVLFYDDPDIVPSDVLACFFTLGHKHLKRLDVLKNDESELLQVLQNPDCSSCKPRPWMTVSSAAHYMKYSLATYGWSHYVYTSRSAFFGFIQVLTRSKNIPRPIPDHIIGDSPLLNNTAAILMVTQVPFEDFVYITFENSVYQLPFFVVLDKDKKKIVIAIRGTLSMQDVVTDLIGFGETMADTNIPNGEAHEGIYMCATKLFKKLVHGDMGKDPILKIAQTQLRESVGEEVANEYKLVVTGHSLGAGVAAVLAILLREIKQYKDLICFAYSPPGGLLSIEAARYTEEFVFSVVIEDDIVPRLGLLHLYRFKLQSLRMLKVLDVPKHEAFRKPLERIFAKLLKPSDSRITPSNSWEGNSEATEIVEKFQSGIDRVIEHTIEELNEHTELFLPGCVLYVQGITNGRHKGYFTRGDSEHFKEVVLCNNMAKHHMPIVVLNALKALENAALPIIVSANVDL